MKSIRTLTILVCLLLQLVQKTHCQEEISNLKDVYVFEPIYQEGPEALLICIPGMFVPGKEYIPVCEGIQKATPFRTWLTIIDFVGSFVTGIGIEKGLDLSIEKVREAGFSNITNSDVYIWAHSSGGISGAELIADRRYGGYMLFGSYLTYTTIDKYPIPVLTVGGELDGLCQITKIADEYEVFNNYLKSTSDNNNNKEEYRQVVASKGVVVLEGMNHAQMCNGFIQGKIEAEDFEPEITQQEANDLIARISSAFIRVHHLEGVSGSSYLTIETFVNRTNELVSGFLKAKQDDVTYWCEKTQTIVANLNISYLLNVDCIHETDFDAFVESKAQLIVENDIAYVTTHSYLSFNLLAQSSEYEIMSQGRYASEAACKCKSQEAIVDALNNPSVGIDGKCRDEHLALFDWALNAVDRKSKSRYLKVGKQLEFIDDIEQPTGGDWVPSSLLFDTTQNPVKVAASRLFSPNIPSPFGGATYCKTLPAARAIAWILHDSLPRGLKPTF